MKSGDYSNIYFSLQKLVFILKLVGEDCDLGEKYYFQELFDINFRQHYYNSKFRQYNDN